MISISPGNDENHKQRGIAAGTTAGRLLAYMVAVAKKAARFPVQLNNYNRK